MRTNIEIDDETMKQAFSVPDFKTKQEFVQNQTRKNLADLRGKIRFAVDYDYKAMRTREIKG